MRHLLRLRDLPAEDIEAVIRRGLEIKRAGDRSWRPLEGRGMLLLFEKTSTRTSLSFQSAMAQLGGYSVVMNWKDSNFSLSPIRHEIRYASRNCDIVMARLRSHDSLRELARYSQVPVINGCDERYHPSQALADFMTMLEVSGRLAGNTLCYVGVRNNVSNCLLEGCLALGIRLLLVTPLENPGAVDPELDELGRASGLVERRDSLADAIKEAGFVYTDTWIDMEHFNDPAYQQEKRRRIELMTPFQVNAEHLAGADPWIMHDMPIHPGYEISEEAVDAPKSVIFQQAENRMHAEKALVLHLLDL
jgi:ornithine carbamoyltransferase